MTFNSSAQASASNPQFVYLSISTPPLSPEALFSNRLPEYTLQDIKRAYPDFAEIVEPPRTGFILTLGLNFGKFPHRKGMKLLYLVSCRSKQLNLNPPCEFLAYTFMLKHMLSIMNLERCTPINFTSRPEQEYGATHSI